MTQSWDDIRRWRKSTRAELLAKRSAMPRSDKLFLRPVIGGQIPLHFPELRHACIGFYWPIKSEIDLRNLVRDCLALGAEAALPVVTEKQQPLEFWSWRPRMKLSRGFWNIPVPAERNPVRPTALLVPLIGFDNSGYRLGYGGGYYDRTLAQLDPRPLTIGVGYASGRLATIFPQPHDIPLDAIVTEAGVVRYRYRGKACHNAGRQESAAIASAASAAAAGPMAPAGYASPPCAMHELDPSYLGYMGTPEVIDLLNLLLKGERAGARALSVMAQQASGTPERSTFRHVAMDEAQFCAMLTRHLKRLGGTPSTRTGEFYDKLVALDGTAERVDFLNRGQNWVVRKLRDGLQRIGDDSLHRDLTNMLDVHVQNIQRCEEMQQMRMDEAAG